MYKEFVQILLSVSVVSDSINASILPSFMQLDTVTKRSFSKLKVGYIFLFRSFLELQKTFVCHAELDETLPFFNISRACLISHSFPNRLL